MSQMNESMTQEPISQVTAETPAAEKKSYSVPELVAHGTVETVTESIASNVNA
jgi:hypothetical protein